MTPEGTRRVEAECAEGAAAFMGRARALPYVQDVTIFGNSLHLLVEGEVSDAQIATDLCRVGARGGRGAPDRADARRRVRPPDEDSVRRRGADRRAAGSAR